MVIAAGVESMTRVPMGIPTILAMQAGIGVGPWSDAIKDRYGVAEFSQFTGAEMMVDKYGFDRATLDAFAVDSHRKAAAATESGAFEAEIVAAWRIEGGVHDRDEGIRADASVEGARQRSRRSRPTAGSPPATPARSATAPRACWWCRRRALKLHGLTPLARIDNLTVTAGDPVIMLDEPINATRRALERSGGTSTRSTCTRSTRRSRRCRWRGCSRSGRQSGAAQRQRRRDRARPSAWAQAGPS